MPAAHGGFDLAAADTDVAQDVIRLAQQEMFVAPPRAMPKDRAPACADRVGDGGEGCPLHCRVPTVESGRACGMAHRDLRFESRLHGERNVSAPAKDASDYRHWPCELTRMLWKVQIGSRQNVSPQ